MRCVIHVQLHGSHKFLYTNNEVTMKKRYIIQSVVGLLAFVVFLNSYTTVESGHNKVAALFGSVQPEPLQEGFHIVNPMLDFVTFDLRQITETWEKVEVPSQDKLKTSMDVSVTFRLDGSRTPAIYQETGTLQDVVHKHVTPKVRSLLREAGKTVEKSQDFYLDSVQQELQRYMESGLTSYLSQKGVVVEAVLFRDITLPSVVTEAVIQTKERQEQLEREKAQLMIVEQQAQQQVKEAEAREKAAVSDAKARITKADAEAYEIKKLAEAQAEANKLLSRSLTTNLIKYNAVEKWNGTYPTTMLGEGTGTLISLPSN